MKTFISIALVLCSLAGCSTTTSLQVKEYIIDPSLHNAAQATQQRN